MVGDSRLEDREDIINHIDDFFTLYANEEWDRPSLDNLAFATSRGDRVAWLEREFDEEEVRAAVFALLRG